MQSATPQEIYLNPVSQNVANSVGDPNIIKGFSKNGRVETALGTFVSAYEGALDVSIRPECIELSLDSKVLTWSKNVFSMDTTKLFLLKIVQVKYLDQDHYLLQFLKLETKFL